MVPSDANWRALNPQVSIVVPVYNKEGYLEECLISILGQSFSNIEVICVDDFSSDGCRDILADFSRRDPRIRTYRNPANMGLGPLPTISESRRLGADTSSLRMQTIFCRSTR